MKPSILAPAGSLESLNAAIKAGANAVYFGTKQFNMRATAKNFETSQLSKIVDICHSNGVKAHLTLNVQIYEQELEKARNLLKYAKKANIDAIIAWDPAVISFANKLNIPIHISTQASVANSFSALYYERLGAKVVVLARELTLDQISNIKNKLKKAGSNLKIETFAHGAMCVAVSGRCFLSHFAYGKSANRGECAQPCRRSYRIIDDSGTLEYKVESNTLLSPKDLCTLPILPKLIDAGIDILKIEGRNRSPEYVYEVINTYKTALDKIVNDSFDEKFVAESLNRLNKVYNKGFHTGFYEGTPSGEDFSNMENSASSRRKYYIGKISKVYKKINVFDLLLHTGELSIGSKIMITGKTTGITYAKIVSMMDDNGNFREKVSKGELVGVKTDLSENPRPNDKVFIFKNISEDKT